jgi:hypothetical protein
MRTIFFSTLAVSILVTGSFAQEVKQRRENQQDRIANGIASGKLSASETARLEKGQAAINQETRTDRALNGGHLTQGEKQQINRQQNRASGRIYRAKHN